MFKFSSKHVAMRLTKGHTKMHIRYIGPVDYICHTVPRKVLNTTYGMSIIRPGPGEDQDRRPTAQELIDAYGGARGIMSGSGDANGPSCARILLKDFVDGKLLYCESPPCDDDDDHGVPPPAPRVKKEALGGAKASLAAVGPVHARRYVDAVDLDFFGSEGTRALVRDRAAAADAAAAAPAGATGKPSKKHFKGGRKEKTRRRAASAKDTAGFVAL
jgi:large subunit GTPase 1